MSEMQQLEMAAGVGAVVAERLEHHLVIQPTLTLEDASKQLGISTQTLRNWCNSGKIPHIRVDKFYRIKPADLNDFLNRNYKRA